MGIESELHLEKLEEKNLSIFFFFGRLVDKVF